MDPSDQAYQKIENLFSDNYYESRLRFRQSAATIRKRWPDAVLGQTTINDHEDLTIDWIRSDGLQRNRNLLIMTTAEHGIEGYIGAAVLQWFIENHCSKLDPNSTGLVLIHAINPWGMAHFRRTNEHNIDLNRNFVLNPEDLDPSLNPDYRLIDNFLCPSGAVRRGFQHSFFFLYHLISIIRKLGVDRFRNALLQGQYINPKGIFYGGQTLQEETRWYQEFFNDVIGRYEQIVHLDMHTGYGPRYQMSLVNSNLEPRSSKFLEKRYRYPQVVNTTQNEFYVMNGDLIDYEYKVIQQNHPERKFYATTFEFGTLGDSLLATIQSLWTKVQENRTYWFGTSSDKIKDRIMDMLRTLYYPNEKKWRNKAIRDADQAINGILIGEGFIRKKGEAGT